MKTEFDDPARQPKPDWTGGSVNMVHAGRNMVDSARMDDLPGLPNLHVEQPPQRVIQEPIVVLRNAGGTYALMMSS